MSPFPRRAGWSIGSSARTGFTARPRPHNRREISLRLSQIGERLLTRYDERRVELLEECLERVPSERQEAVLGALAELAQVSHP